MEASKIVNNDFGNNRFVEYKNSLYYILTQSNYKKENLSEISSLSSKQMYVQSPMTTRNKIYISKLVRSSNIILKLKSLHVILSPTLHDQNKIRMLVMDKRMFP